MRYPHIDRTVLRRGLGMVEIVIAVALAIVIGALAIPVARDALIAQRGRSSASNLQIFEAAKRAFVADNPGVNLTNSSQLLPYLPGGVIPTGVHVGEVYSNTLNLNAFSASSVNGNTNYEPWSTNFGPATSNGFNDLGNAQFPTFSQLLPTVGTPLNNAPPLIQAAGSLASSTNDNSNSVSFTQSSNGVVILNFDSTTTTTPGTYTPVSSYVILTAVPNYGYTFSQWVGDIHSSNSTLNVTLTNNISETPSYALTNFTATLTTNTVGVASGSGGTLSMDGGNTFPYLTPVTIRAVPTPIYYVFSGWSGDVTSTNATNTFILTNNASITGTFSPATYTVTTSVQITGVPQPYSSSLLQNMVISPTGVSTYTAGSVATISASSVSEDWTLNGFYVDNSSVLQSGTPIDSGDSYQITMTSNHTVAASYTYTPQHVLDLSASNTVGSATDFLNLSAFDSGLSSATSVSPQTINRGAATAVTTTINSSASTPSSTHYWVSMNSLGLVFDSTINSQAASNIQTVSFLGAPGSYTVSGQLASGASIAGPSTASVTVVDVPPAVSITPSTNVMFLGYPVTFTVSASDVAGLDTTGIFSMPSASTNLTFTNSATIGPITMNQLGLQTATLSATGPFGATSSVSATINVVSYPLSVSFSSNTNQVSRNQVVTFTATSSDTLGFPVNNTFSWTGSGFTESFTNNASIPLSTTNIGLQTATLVSSGHYGQLVTNSLSVNVIANLILYDNSSVGYQSQLYQLNIGSTSDPYALVLQNANQSQINAALAQLPAGESVYNTFDQRLNAGETTAMGAQGVDNRTGNAYSWHDNGYIVVDANTGQVLGIDVTGLPVSGTIVDTINGSTPTSVSWSDWYQINYYDSPVTISLSGKADFLSGEWRAGHRNVNLLAMRKFNLDGKGKRLWDWVGPTEGILVWNPKHLSNMHLSGADLFSIDFRNGKYKNGYEALAAIATPGAKEISGSMLKDIYIWVDKNSNAIVDEGELLPITDYGITSLSIAPATDDRGGLVCTNGAVTSTGYAYPTRDWWSLGGASDADVDDFLKGCVHCPSVYGWSPDYGLDNPLAVNPPQGFEPMPFGGSGAGGNFRFDLIGTSIKVTSLSLKSGGDLKKAVYSIIKPVNGCYEWNFLFVDGTDIHTRFTVSPNAKHLYGITTIVKKGKRIGYYTWSASPSLGPNLCDLLYIIENNSARKSPLPTE